MTSPEIATHEENHDAHVRAYRTREGLQEVLAMHDHFLRFSRREALILQIILEKGPLDGSSIRAFCSLVNEGKSAGRREDGTYVLLSRLSDKGILQIHHSQGTKKYYDFTEKWATIFRVWKLLGKQLTE